MSSLYDAPMRRTWIDSALPWLRGAFGALFVAYSAISTIIFLGSDMIWLFAFARLMSIATGIADAYWYASFIALVIFLGEIATSERYPKTYRLFLWPDAFYSARGLQAGLAGAFTVMLSPYLVAQAFNGMTAAALVGWAAAWPPAFFFGYKIAKWGEILLFGQRRNVTTKADENGETVSTARATKSRRSYRKD